MMKTESNMQKYGNYKEQMGRLKKALNSQFYLEAISIEYAVLEDRVESVLRHSEVFRPKKHNTITKKLNRLSVLCGDNKLAGKYFTDELISSIHEWKNERNPMTHALLNLHLHTEDLQKIAEDGEKLVKTMCSKSSLYNRAIDRKREKEGSMNV
ncbi:MAG: hypothetical protein K6C08_12755 [Oscillospiraceae bacterium]|nr:hypothetical protein [Oscillospiraceae bacterium]